MRVIQVIICCLPLVCGRSPNPNQASEFSDHMYRLRTTKLNDPRGDWLPLDKHIPPLSDRTSTAANIGAGSHSGTDVRRFLGTEHHRTLTAQR